VTVIGIDDMEKKSALTIFGELKPKLRGWIHAGTAPFVIALTIVLLVITPGTAEKIAVGVFGLTALLLFGMSAIYHIGNGRMSIAATKVLKRIDHANIFLIIAGTYTPLAVLLLPQNLATQMLLIVWGGAAVGILAHMFWMNAPRWVYVPVYIALGWVAVAYMGPLFTYGGWAVVSLIFSGGLAYTAGAVIYGLKRPNPAPRWFGFHEIFHSLTVAGFACHTVAIFIAAVALRYA
jgi:hemolysin III